MAHLPRIELSLRRLDARPLDGQPMRVLVQLAQQSEVFAIAVVVVGCDSRGITVCDPSRLLLPLPPVGVAVVTLDLVSRARGSPKESFRKWTRHGTLRGCAGRLVDLRRW